jgi:hypothetical protein
MGEQGWGKGNSMRAASCTRGRLRNRDQVRVALRATSLEFEVPFGLGLDGLVFRALIQLLY